MLRRIETKIEENPLNLMILSILSPILLFLSDCYLSGYDLYAQ